MTRRTIGDQELALLEHVAERGPASVGQVAESFGASAGLARTTVLTMMERLRKKGHLERRRVDGVWHYASPRGRREILTGVVRSFVETTLSGSVSPFVAYLSEAEEISEEELDALRSLVARLEEEREP